MIIPRAASLAVALCLLWPARVSAEAESVQVIGQVVDPTGQPASAVRVWALAHVNGQSRCFETSTDVSGHYQAAVPSQSERIAVLAWKPSFAASASEVARFDLPWLSGAPAVVMLDVQLQRAHPLSVQILDPENQPVAATLHLSSLSNSQGVTSVRLSDPVDGGIDAVRRTTDAAGFAAVDYQPAEGVVTVVVETQAFGTQTVVLDASGLTESLQVKLQPVAYLNVTSAGIDADQLAGRVVRAYSRQVETQTQDAAIEPTPSGKRSVTRPTYALSHAKLDSRGQAKLTVIAGQANISFEQQLQDTHVAAEVEPIQTSAGATQDVPLTFQPAVRVTGRIVDPDGQPVPGVEIKSAAISTGGALVTDVNGQYEFPVATGKRFYANIHKVPRGFAKPNETSIQLPPENEPATEQLTIPDFRIERAVEFSGRVVDDQGNPVRWAQVEVAWRQSSSVNQTFTRRSDLTRTDAQGTFQLPHVLANVDCRLSAETPTAATKPMLLRSDTDQQAELVVSADGVAHIAGSVRGSDGSVIQHPQVRVSRAQVVSDGNVYGNRTLSWHGSETLAGDARGQFRTPLPVPRFEKYSLEVSADGYESATIAYRTPPEQGDLEVGVVELSPSRSAAGLVTNSQGKPLQGVTVSGWSAERATPHDGLKRISVSTDAAGRFQLSQLHPQAALIFVHHEGYRPNGAVLEPATSELQITLYQTSEVRADRGRLVVKSTENERTKAARSLFKAMLPTRRDSNYFHTALIDMMARVDHDLLADELDRTTAARSRMQILLHLNEIDDAEAELETIEDGYSRAYSRLGILDHINDPRLAHDLLSAALLDADAIRRPDRRVVIVANVADRFCELGELQTAERIVRDQQQTATALATTEWPGFARMTYAEQLARFDLEAALAMVDQAPVDDQTRHLRNIAHLIAATDPAGAERALDKIQQMRYVDSPVVRVAYRMAPVDLERSLRLVDRIVTQQRPVAKARALGVISYAIKDQDPLRARELLSQAFDDLRAQSVHHRRGYRDDEFFGTGLTLLGYAEDVDPDQLADYFWLAADLYGGPAGRAWSPDDAAEADADRRAQLAILLAQYGQPEAARRLAQDTFDHWESRIGGRTDAEFTRRPASFIAMALSDPQRAVDWAHRFDQALSEQSRRYIPQPWEVIGNALTHTRSELSKMITGDVYHRWTIDTFDF